MTADPHDPVVEEIGPGLWSVPMPVPLPVRFTLAYVLVDAGEALVIDPGWPGPGAAPALVEALRRAGAVTGGGVRIVATHGHLDHLGGAPALAAATGARTAVHGDELAGAPTTRAEWRAHEDRTLAALGVPIDERDAARIPDDGVDATIAATRADEVLVDGDGLAVGTRRLRVLHTPGHTPGSICLFEPATGLVFTGDTLLARITPNISWVDGGPADPLDDYRRSLARIAALGATKALPGHGQPFDDPARRASEILRHHDERSHEVAQRLRDADTAWSLAERLTWSRGWDSLAGFQRRIAAGETAAHLRMLAAHGAVAHRDGERTADVTVS